MKALDGKKAPMPRSQGILILRRLLKTASPDTSLVSIGAHSPKVSWARQVGASAQGHHRAAGARLNVSLYGRDDVHEALTLTSPSASFPVGCGTRDGITVDHGGLPVDWH